MEIHAHDADYKLMPKVKVNLFLVQIVALLLIDTLL